MRKRSPKQNTRGFTLVELIVAVAILAVVAAPLLYSFVSSSHFERKGRDINAATLAAQNIQERLTASSISYVQDGSCFAALTETAPVAQTVEQEQDICWKLQNVPAAGQNFDALVTLKGSEYDSISIPSESSMDAVFAQPQANSSSDPDSIAKKEAGDLTLTRQITVDIVSTDKENSESDKIVSDITVTYGYSASGSFSTNYTYDILMTAYEQIGTKPMNVYIMYNPFESGKDVIVINNTNDVPLNLFIISQGGNKSNELQIRQYQSSAYSSENQNVNLYCIKDEKLMDYKIFNGKIWYFNGDYQQKLFATQDSPSLYATEIQIFPHGSDQSIYTLNASKCG